MPTLTPYKLRFHGGMRVGTHGVNLEETGVGIPSDTLFAALVDTYRRRGGDPARLMEPFVAEPVDPPFLLTSAFPFVGDVRFFPMPVNLRQLFRKSTTWEKQGKAIKRIRFLSHALWDRALAGESLDDWLFPEDPYEEPTSGVALQGGTVWLTLPETELLPAPMQRRTGRRHALRRLSAYATSRVPRVTVDRVNAGSNIFFAGRTTFAEDCGLWFGVHWQRPDDELEDELNQTYRDAFMQTLAVLQDDGLGGERTAGYGAFTYAADDAFNLPEPSLQQPAWLLSRYHPRQEELPDVLTTPGTAYQMTAVGGWLRSPDGAAMRRKRLMLVAEGSLVAWPGATAGDVVDVRPTYENPAGDLPHPVYRYGLALAAGLKEESDA